MITTSRIGKIARLPHSIREQLNLKLHDGIPAKSVLPWLNSLPEVKSVLVADFDNRLINKQNLSEWKQGGFRDWLLQFHAAHFLQFMDSQSSSSSIPVPLTEIQHGGEQRHELSNSLMGHATPSHPPSSIEHPVSPFPLTSKLLLWTQLQYTTMARSIDAETDPQRKWSSLRQFANDISRLRRSSLADDYLQIQRDWLALSQSNTAAKKEQEFWKWTQRPDIEKKLFPNRRPGLTPEQLYQFEKDTCLMDGPGPEIAELMAEVRIAKKLLELRKAQEAEAKAKAAPDYDPNRPLPDTRVRLAGMPFEELFPTIPEKPLTETHPELDDCDPETGNGSSDNGTATHSPEGDAESPLPTGEGQGEGEQTIRQPTPLNQNTPASDSSDQSDQSDPVKPSQTQSNQIQPTPPSDCPI